jgi:hypothetical protein
MAEQYVGKDNEGELSRLARSHRLADVYVFGSRSKEIAALIRNGEAGKGP